MSEIKLTDLNPCFVSTGGDGITNSKTGEPVPYRAGVGIGFDCPCGDKDCCRVYLSFENPIGGGEPVANQTIWQRTGETFEDITLKPSIQRLGKCRWHGFLTNGVLKSV